MWNGESRNRGTKDTVSMILFSIFAVQIFASILKSEIFNTLTHSQCLKMSNARIQVSILGSFTNFIDLLVENIQKQIP